ncbi:MAG: hypothetical protein M1834_005992 [Cirrosporium novae-zelandiae]|nr:MAG: hypothetical protein M1834_005992 [Cirrosporium novae-zelandiae]
MAVCAACEKPLVFEVEPDSDNEIDQGPGPSSSQQEIVPDDVCLPCGCHFHWECLIEAYTVTECPKCFKSLATMNEKGEEQLLCTLQNEGGLQENLDILPELREEAYLKAYPDERKCRAFLEYCKNGDVEAIIGVLHDDEEEEEQNHIHTPDILRYQDAIGGMRSGLHLAVINNQFDTAWLLLWMASNLDTAAFPPDLMQLAQGMGVQRHCQPGSSDIRELKDSDGLTALNVANMIGGDWIAWIEAGRL